MVSQSGHADKQPNTKEAVVPILSKEQAETLNKASTQGEDIPLIGESSEKKLDESLSLYR